MSLVFDAGALVAVEQGDRDVMALLKAEVLADRVPVTHGAVVGQVWRGGARQARLARFLGAVEVVPVDEGLGRRSGALLGRARRSDLVDAAIVLLAEDGDWILTGDPDDLQHLADVAGVHVDLVPV